MKTIYNKLFSTTAAGFYMIVFAVAIGAATFIENDYGTSAAQKVIFKAGWFELLLVLFGLSILANIFRFRMVQQKKWSTLAFHAAILIILIGAGVTRYFSYEGTMHIREDSTSNEMVLSDTYLLFEARQNGKAYRFDEKVNFASLGKNKFKETYQIGNDVIDAELEAFIPNPENVLEPSATGVPIIKIVIGGNNGREEYYLKDKDYENFNGSWFNFGNPERPEAFNIYYRNDSLVLKSPEVLAHMVMATQKRDTVYPGVFTPLVVRSLYTGSNGNFAIGDFNPSAELMMRSSGPKMKSESVAALKMKISINGQPSEVFIYGNKGMEGEPEVVKGGNTELAVSYGAKRIQLPFGLKLRDFILDKYPGTESASSYASEVTLIDPRENLNRDQRIYMNNILDYGGYRFFQSSYDQDELGTVLSVNHDFWGTWISYIGYIMLTLGMVLTLFHKRSRFVELSNRLKDMHMTDKPGSVARMILLLMFVLPVNQYANNVDEHQLHVISKEHAAQFGRLLVQDQKGRMKPMNTLASEVLRKIARKESVFGLTSDQVFLGMTLYPEEWVQQPIIKIGTQEEIRKLLPTAGELASFNDFFSASGQYLLRDQVRKAYSLQPIDRSMFDKDIMKIDERVNICNMIFSGSMARIYPVENHPTDQWITPADALHPTEGLIPAPFIQSFFNEYVLAVQDAVSSQEWTEANKKLETLHQYQQQKGGELLISQTKVDMEILLNKMDVFSRLTSIYGLLGLVFLILFFAKVFKPELNMRRPTQIATILLAASFIAHTAGLAIRWYVSGRAPWSNGYESMIYIGFTTVLAGLIFTRKSLGGLTATSILASTILMVAGLSWLDPEITPLVPVLKSYWLTIHVSLEAGSYGFLMLGAIIGLLNLVLMIFLSPKNEARIFRTIKEMSYISEMTLYGGLLMVSTGTYLGGVWANESWGRYWGWDAKETWALVTTLVYAFILHMRFIPGLRGNYAFSVASLFGFASVMMTYFGVNYYLSGLHSYAAGDPVPMPPSVYYTAAVFTTISLLAYWKYKKYKT
ncbi:MAG: cytochrome c biogenesis protein CcsA [Saprospiraceae bacterium]|nr:cytochrome c biogenesis protein CcsA [Candidatus Opimibacter iunctus]